MAMLNIIAFVDLKILHNLDFMQKFLFTNNCWYNQNFEKHPR